MKVLVVGSGGREHMIAKTLLRGGSVTEVVCAPGNPGMSEDGVTVANVGVDEHDALVQLALEYLEKILIF